MSELAPDQEFFVLEKTPQALILRLCSKDGANRLGLATILSLTRTIHELESRLQPLIITGNEKFFSVGADLGEIAALAAGPAFEFSRIGQSLMQSVEQLPSPVYAAISGYCMGGGLDLALACHHRIASPHAIFGHRGTALGLITGWGGTQRLPRLVGKSRALEVFVTAEKITAHRALEIGLIEAVAENPVAEALCRIQRTVTGEKGNG